MSSFSSKNCILLLLLALTSAANAHFRLILPFPRGPVNYTTETEFCGESFSDRVSEERILFTSFFKGDIQMPRTVGRISLYPADFSS
jgi:hypothetical protein